jgi:hypothetical protein
MSMIPAAIQLHQQDLSSDPILHVQEQKLIHGLTLIVREVRYHGFIHIRSVLRLLQYLLQEVPQFLVL